MSMKPKGIAARAGHWSARHRKTAIFGWLGLIIALFLIGGSVGQKQPTAAQKQDGDSRKAMQIYEDAGFEKKTSEMVLVQSKTQDRRRSRIPGCGRRRRQVGLQAVGRRQRHQRRRVGGPPLGAGAVRHQG